MSDQFRTELAKAIEGGPDLSRYLHSVDTASVVPNGCQVSITVSMNEAAIEAWRMRQMHRWNPGRPLDRMKTK